MKVPRKKMRRNLLRTKDRNSILTKQMSASVMAKSNSQSSLSEYRAGKFGLRIRTGPERSNFSEQNDGRRPSVGAGVGGGDVVYGNSTAISIGHQQLTIWNSK